jgi:hypothetical protein
MRCSKFPDLARTLLRAGIYGGVLVAAAAFAQPAPTNMMAANEIVLATKTPLGDASITISAGTVLTNCVLSGENVSIRQGPFAATVDLADVEPIASATATPTPTSTPTPTPTPATPQTAEQTPSPASSAAATQPAAESSTTAVGLAGDLPDWVVPAAGGALVAYAIFTTLALLLSRRRRRRSPISPSKAEQPKKPPVVAMPAKPTPKPAVVADGGQAIACPLCGKNIAMEKVGKGRNRCPHCDEAFVVE